MRESFAGKIREAAKALGAGGKEFRADELGDRAGLQTRSDLRRMYQTIIDFIRAGDIERVEKGVYRYRGKPAERPQIQLVMWRIMRARRAVTIEDLQELAGASAAYAKQWLMMLARRQIVRKLSNGKYHLIQDLVKMPQDEEKAQKLRKIRERKKAALKALDQAFSAIADARKAISQCEVD